MIRVPATHGPDLLISVEPRAMVCIEVDGDADYRSVSWITREAWARAVDNVATETRPEGTE